MTNNAVNPIVYIYSNVNIQRFLILKCLPKFIAVKTETYQEYVKAKQNKIFSTTAAIKAAKDDKRKIPSFTSTGPKSKYGNSSKSTVISSSLSELKPKRQSPKKSTTYSNTMAEECVDESQSVVRGEKEKAEKRSTFTKHKSLCKLARKVSVGKHGLKKTKSVEDRPSFGLMYKEFMESQLEAAVEGECRDDEDVKEELCQVSETTQCKL